MTRLIGIFATLFCLCASMALANDPPMPEIAGLTVEDKVPGACVDCHVNMPENKMDVRLSSQMARWARAVDEKSLAKVRTIVPKSVKLLGKHPQLSKDNFRDLPASCMACHRPDRIDVPQMGPMLHALHFLGGRDNHFLTLFKGQCTHCHKFDKATGVWSVPSGPEK